MKKSKLYLLTALVASGVLMFASCAPTAATGDTAAQPEGNMEERSQSPDDMTGSEDNMEKEFTGDAYNFSLTDTQGNSYMLSDLQGKKVYIKFWASWCSICLAGIEELKELDTAYKDNDDVLVLTMVAPGASGEMGTDKFKDWFSSQEYEFTALLDGGGVVMRKYGIRGFPTSVFIDTEGNVALTKIGHVDNAAIEDTLSGMS